MNFHAFRLCPAQDMNHSFVQHLLPLKYLVANPAVRLTVPTSVCSTDCGSACVQVTEVAKTYSKTESSIRTELYRRKRKYMLVFMLDLKLQKLLTLCYSILLQLSIISYYALFIN